MTDVATLIGAFSAGMTTFFAPCAFPLLPGYIGYYVGTVDEEQPVGGALVRGLAASVGIVAVFAGLGLVASTLGRELLQHLTIAEPAVGVIVILLGLVMLSGYSPQFHVELPGRATSVLGFGLFGGGYAFAATGCFAPVFIAVVLQGSAGTLVESVLLTLVFALGMAVLFVATTVSVAVGQDVSMSRFPLSPANVQRVAGLVIVVAGAWQLHEALRLL